MFVLYSRVANVLLYTAIHLFVYVSTIYLITLSVRKYFRVDIYNLTALNSNSHKLLLQKDAFYF